jgi:LuxR family maltose regulon positive regulatory protein
MQQTQLLTTKLAIPPLPPTLIKRPRLVERLHQGVSRRLTLLSAPAGFGKTTLLSEWQASSLGKSYQLAWVSLDEADNDPVRFWSYVIRSLDILYPGLGDDAMGLLHSSLTVPIESVLVTLLNALPDTFASGAEQREIALVLDDYHLIQAEPIHRTITFLLDFLPRDLHLIIATRVDPPLSLARFRVREQSSELRTSELRFTRDEAKIFLNQAMKLGLSETDASELEARTEGWIAGLQLAALSIRSQPGAPLVLEDFTGSHHYVSDFFIEEVLKRQARDVQDFLLHTSVLQRLSAELCDAVTSREGSQAMLERIETSNLFLIPLDAERHWYRYHALFGDALRRYLRREHSAEFVQELHRRAAAWYDSHGFFSDAIEHALVGADMEQAGQFIERAARAAWMRGEWVSLLGWLERLPESVIRKHPGLCFFSAWALIAASRGREAEQRLVDAEAALRKQPCCSCKDVTPETARLHTDMLAELMTLRATVARMQEDASRTIAFSHQALEFVSQGDAILRSTIALNLGHAYSLRGDVKAATQAFRESITQGRSAQNTHTVLLAMSSLAEIQIAAGLLHQAYEQLEQAIRFAREHGSHHVPLMCLIFIKKGELYYEWNELEAAAHHLKQGIELGNELGPQNRTIANYLARGHLALAGAMQAQGKEGEAHDHLAQAYVLVQYTQLNYLTAQVAGTQLRLWTFPGSPEAVSEWATECGLSVQDTPEVRREREYLTFTRFLIRQGQLQGVQELLEQLRQNAQVGGRKGRVIEIIMLQALAYQAQSQAMQALMLIQQALAMAEPEGYIRLFVDEGTVMETLLSKLVEMYRQRKLSLQGQFSWEYVKKLLTQLNPGKQQSTDRSRRDVSHVETENGVIQLLSRRERDILYRIAHGLSNQAIADEMVIELSTVKSHLKHIYRKLNVESRTQAVALARKLGLL